MKQIHFCVAALLLVLGARELLGENKNRDGVRDTGRVNPDAQRVDTGKSAAGRATENLANPNATNRPAPGARIPGVSAVKEGAKSHAAPPNAFEKNLPGTKGGRVTDEFAKKVVIETTDPSLKQLAATEGGKDIIENGVRVENLKFGASTAEFNRSRDSLAPAIKAKENQAIKFGDKYIAKVNKLNLPPAEKEAVLASLKIFLHDISLKTDPKVDEAKAKQEQEDLNNAQIQLDKFLEAFKAELGQDKTPEERIAAAKFIAGSLAFYGKDADPNSNKVDLDTPLALWQGSTGDHRKGLAELYGKAAEIETSYVAAQYKSGNSFTGTGDKQINPVKVWENTRKQMADWTQVRLLLNGTSPEEAKKISEDIMCCTNHGSISAGCKVK